MDENWTCGLKWILWHWISNGYGYWKRIGSFGFKLKKDNKMDIDIGLDLWIGELVWEIVKWELWIIMDFGYLGLKIEMDLNGYVNGYGYLDLKMRNG